MNHKNPTPQHFACKSQMIVLIYLLNIYYVINIHHHHQTKIEEGRLKSRVTHSYKK